MGLDMYLYRESFVGNKFRKPEDFLTVGGKTECGLSGKPLNIRNERISAVVEEVGYWRKANAIHNWFVQNVQDGKDECQRSYVDTDQLHELLDLCKTVVEHPEKAPELFPSRPDFFFGGTEYDEYYFDCLKETIKILSAILDEPDDQGEYYYQASW